MDRILFIDRDGTLIVEPPDTHQVDSLEKLALIPGAVAALSRIAKETDYRLVMVTNQDGLGTERFPEANFWPVHNRMLEIFQEADVRFQDVLIDRSLPEENAPTRKPRTGLLQKYLSPAYDLGGSYVIGDRLTDMALAKNIGAKGIWIQAGAVPAHSEPLKREGLTAAVVLVTQDWAQVAEFLIR